MIYKIRFIMQAQRRNSKEKSNGNTRNKNQYLRHEEHVMSLSRVVTAEERLVETSKTEMQRRKRIGRKVAVWGMGRAEGRDRNGSNIHSDNGKSFQN